MGEQAASVRGNQQLLVDVAEVGTFAVMGIHTSPRAAEKELDALVPAYDATARALGVNVSQHGRRVMENDLHNLCCLFMRLEKNIFIS